ncbi:hypothetical protein P3T76_014842 [Phytophthora citrophthora]|uniref:Uncharacterized protein n=1 Tax=Phytophthora citrophthora TaxID=4793 RepID=A0AAD9G0K5_9STRA|nr:hypothetical protein P3T76_014842 [Phytophthora citrophthora]
MACASPNQWALTSPTASSSSRSSRLRLTSGDRQDDASDVDIHEAEGDEMIEQVRQLIVDLMVDERSSQAVASHTGTKHRSNNPEAEEDTRERLLEEKLAHVLVELASEQDNLRLAANAGNALLEELSTAREEIDTLHDELEVAQVDRDQSVREVQRLREQIGALENELERYDAPYGSWDSTGQQNALSNMQQQRRRSSLTSRSGSFTRTDSCERCASREVEVTQLEQRADEVRRRCLELELARERELQRQRELAEEINQLQQHNKEQHLETVRAQQDLEIITAQLEQQTQELEQVQAVRDTLRRTARRLETENEDFRERLQAREALVTKLENSKARAATQLQVAENRTASAQAETKRVSETLEKLQKQLENALRRGSDPGSGDTTRETSKKSTDDMEQLLDDATREVAALRLENRILRRQSSAEATTEGNRLRGRRRKTMCTGNSATTAADVLALGIRESKKETNSSGSGSEIEMHKPLPPLEIETINTVKPEELLSGDGKKRRKMSLELDWVDRVATSSVDTAVREDGEEKATGGAGTTSVLSRLGRVNDHCVICGTTEANSLDMCLYGTEHRSARDVEHVRRRELPIDELRREATESPPKSPLYLGLSFIACATAATAAGLLVRR